MRLPYRAKPSAGFVCLVLVFVAQLAFLGWGLSRPRLEEVWRLDIELGLGKRPHLSVGELARLQAALIDHPAVAESLSEDKHAGVISANDDGRVEGSYAYLVRTRDAPSLLTVSYAGARKKGAVSINARTVAGKHQGTAKPDQPFTWSLPDGPYPQLVEVRFASANGKKELYPVRIDLRGAP